MDLYDIKKYLDPKWKFVIIKLVFDDVIDQCWGFTETEEKAIEMIKNETEAYGNALAFQFRYEKVR